MRHLILGALLVGTVCCGVLGARIAAQANMPRTTWDRHPDLTGVWQGRPLAAQAYGLSDLEKLYKPDAKAKMMALTDKDDPASGCMPYGSPRHEAMGLPVQIIQAPGGVAILSDRPHMFRYIPTDGKPHEEDVFPTNLGNPVGQWVDDTLVVDIVSLNGKIWLAGGTQQVIRGGPRGFPTSESLHIVERWRLLDANTLEYQATVEDPDMLTRAWTTPKIAYKRSAAEQIGEGICIPAGFDYDAPAVKAN